MTGQTCSTGCGRPTLDVRNLCEQCRWELQRALAEIPALVEELDVTLTRQSAMTEKAGKIHGGKDTPLPFDTGASEAFGLLRTYLVGWVRDLAGDDPGRYPADELGDMSRWLLSRLDLIAVHPAAADIHGEITSACRDAWRVVDRAANRTSFPVGQCPEIDCSGQVWAYIPASEERPARLECVACLSRWETHQWLRVGKRILARLDSSTSKPRLMDSA